MISLLGSVLGFASGVVPEVVGYFRKQQDHKFELELYEAKAKYAEVMTANKLKELDLKAEIQELKSLYKHDQTLTTDSSFISGVTTFRLAGKRYGILNKVDAPTKDEQGAACFYDPETGKKECDL